MNPGRWRCFVAAPIDEGLRASLEQSVDSWQSRPDPASWHVTLAFLGAIDPAEAAAPSGAVLLDRILFVRSHLDRDGARHETLASFTLRGSAHE